MGKPHLSPVFLQDLDEEVSRIADQRGAEKTSGPAKTASHASPSPVPATSPVPETGGTPTPNVEDMARSSVGRTQVTKV